MSKKELPEVVEAQTPLDLPVRYIMFPDELESAIERLEKIEEKLYRRKMIIVKPYKVFRFNGMLAIELEKRA